MDTTTIVQAIASVIGALNNIEVKGKQNIMNLVGAIGVLEELAGSIAAQDKSSDATPGPDERVEGK